jgi:exosortase/archaeosortase family protein
MSISTLTPVQAAVDWRRVVVQSWDDASAVTKTRIKVALFAVVVLAAYHYTLSSLVQTVGFDTPLAYVGLVPLLAAGLAWLRRRPREPEPPIHDRQLDYIIGVPLVAGAVVMDFVLPGHLGVLYWVDRIDLLSLPVFVAGVVTLLFGTRVLWRQRVAVLYLFLAWPWPYTTILLGTLGGFTHITIAGLSEVLKVIPVAQTVPGAANAGLFLVNHHGHYFPVSVVTACSGVDGMVGFFLVGAGFATLVAGPIVRKTMWLACGLALLWTTNLLRLLLIFWIGEHYGEHLSIGILHPTAGLVLFCVDVLLMFAILRPFGLRLIDYGRRAPQQSQAGPGLQPPVGAAPAVPRIFLVGAAVAIVAALLYANNSALRNFDPVASAAGLPRLTSYIADPASPPGWENSYMAQYTSNKPLFGQSSIWYRYGYGEGPNHTSGELTSSVPVIADVINARGLSGFEQYGVTACYSFHGYQLRDVAKVSLGHGISGQALSYSSPSGLEDWTIVYWIWPVKMASGNRYERIILYLQNTAYGSVVLPHGVTGIAGLKNTLQVTNPTDRRLITNRAFLVEFAREVITAQTHQADANATLDSVTSAHVSILDQNSVPGKPAKARTVHSAKPAEVAAHQAAVRRLEAAGKVPDGYDGIYLKAHK